MDVGGTLKGEECLKTAASDSSVNTDDALRYMTYVILDRLHSHGLNCNLYSEEDELSEQLRYVFEKGQLLKLFRNVPDFAHAVSKATRPSTARLSVIKRDKMKCR